MLDVHNRWLKYIQTGAKKGSDIKSEFTSCLLTTH